MKIAVRPAGTLPYLDERPPSRPSAWPFLLLAVIALVGCGVGIGFAVSAAAGGQPIATASLTSTASVTPVVTATATTEESIEPCRWNRVDKMTTRLYEMNGQTLPTCSSGTAASDWFPSATPTATIDLGPTFTLTPTAESVVAEPQIEVIYRDREIVLTSPPRVEYRDREVVREVVITSPPQIYYVIVTATPTMLFKTLTPTPTETPTITETPTATEWATPTFAPEMTLEVVPSSACDILICIPTPVTEIESLPEGFRR